MPVWIADIQQPCSPVPSPLLLVISEKTTFFIISELKSVNFLIFFQLENYCNATEVAFLRKLKQLRIQKLLPYCFTNNYRISLLQKCHFFSFFFLRFLFLFLFMPTVQQIRMVVLPKQFLFSPKQT